MEATLISKAGRTILGSTVVTIGCLPTNQLAIDNSQVSRRHTEIRPAGQGHILIDLGSRNGTFINKRRIVPHVGYLLPPGDEISIGKQTPAEGHSSRMRNTGKLISGNSLQYCHSAIGARPYIAMKWMVGSQLVPGWTGNTG